MLTEKRRPTKWEMEQQLMKIGIENGWQWLRNEKMGCELLSLAAAKYHNKGFRAIWNIKERE